MAFGFVRRTAHGTGFHTPDKDHVHHRLLRLGHGPRRTVLILWAWTAVLSGFVLYPLFRPRANAVIPFGGLALVLVLYTLFHPGLRKASLEVEDEVELAKPRPEVIGTSSSHGSRADGIHGHDAEGDPEVLILRNGHHRSGAARPSGELIADAGEAEELVSDAGPAGEPSERPEWEPIREPVAGPRVPSR